MAEPEKARIKQEIRDDEGKFLPGVSGNPAGKPKGLKSFTTKVREALEKIADGKDYTYEEAFIKSILKNAIVDGKESSQKLIWNYLDGMPVQKQEVTGKDGQPIQIVSSESEKLKAKYEEDLKKLYLE